MTIRKVNLTRAQSMALAVAILVLCVVGFVLNFKKLKGQEAKIQNLIEIQNDEPITQETQEEDYY